MDTAIPTPSLRNVLLTVVTVLALLAATISSADAQEVRQLDRDIQPTDRVETLRLACDADNIDGQRGVLCKWSEAQNPRTRGYQLYRITDGSPRELVTTVGADGRLAFFDTSVSAPSQLIYGVVALHPSGRLIGQSEPVRVQFGQDVAAMRLACHADNIDDQRGIVCRWSNGPDTTRGYLLYRSVDDSARELVARIPADGRNGFFDTDITAGAVHTYGVTAINGNGQVIGIGGPSNVRWPTR